MTGAMVRRRDEVDEDLFTSSSTSTFQSTSQSSMSPAMYRRGGGWQPAPQQPPQPPCKHHLQYRAAPNYPPPAPPVYCNPPPFARSVPHYQVRPPPSRWPPPVGPPEGSGRRFSVNILAQERPATVYYQRRLPSAATTTTPPSTISSPLIAAPAAVNKSQHINNLLRQAVQRLPEQSLLHLIGRQYYLLLSLQWKMTHQVQAPGLSREMEDLCCITVRMLRSCDYPLEDILCLFAVAASRLPIVFPKIRTNSFEEIVNVSIVQVFLAHSWLFDEACPIKEWHQHVFKSYCSFTALNDAMVNLFRLQEFQLHVDPDTVASNIIFLQQDGENVAFHLRPKTDDTSSTRATLTSNNRPKQPPYLRKR